MRGLQVGDIKIGLDFSTNATTVHITDGESGKYTESQVISETTFDPTIEKKKAADIKKAKEPKEPKV